MQDENNNPTLEGKHFPILPLEETVYPNKNASVFFSQLDGEYAGAHVYHMLETSGFEGDSYKYLQEAQAINFIYKRKKGEGFVPGIISEQLLLVLIDRTKKLNSEFPSTDNEMCIFYLKKALKCLEARVRDRVTRGVMGKLEK
ncbi:MAG: hypothetical protein V4543_00830 [Bacteroidota bacterium]